MKIFNTEIKIVDIPTMGRVYQCYKTGGKHWGTVQIASNILQVIEFILW
jgi:hypothetical protein